MAFKRLADRFCRFGTVKQTRVKRGLIVNENNAAAILASAAANPHVSSTQMEKKGGISLRSVLRILYQHKFHPYRISLHQACSHEHVDTTRRCTTPLCSVFKTSDE